LARVPVWLGYILFVVAAVHPFGIVVLRQTIIAAYLGVAICTAGLLAATFFAYFWTEEARFLCT
jgi:hypothetical protein